MTDARSQQQDTARRLACMPYDRSIYACLQCGAEGENTIGRAYGRFRFCSPECATAFGEAVPS